SAQRALAHRPTPRSSGLVAPPQPAGNAAGETGARLSVPVQGAWPAAAPAPTAELPEALRAALEGNAPAPVDSASTSALGLGAARSEEHTSELQSRENPAC